MESLAAELGVPYLHVPTLRREVSPRTTSARCRRCGSLLRGRRPDVLHTHTAKAGTTGRLAALVAGRGRPRAVVHTFHGHVLSGYFGRRRERLPRGSSALCALSTDGSSRSATRCETTSSASGSRRPRRWR